MTTTLHTTRPAAPGIIPGTSRPARTFGGSIFTKTLWDNRRVFAVWALATGLLATFYASFYPQLSAESMASVPETMRGFGLDDMSSAAGYLQGPVFGLLVPLLVTFYGAATGARMISADEESGYLDLLLAHPIGRTRLMLQRFTALAAGAALIGVAVLVGLLAVRGSANLDTVSIGGFAAQALNLVLLGLLFGAVATGIGAATGASRAVAFGATAGLGVLTYALHGFAPQIGADWLRYLTPFYYYISAEPLINSVHVGHVTVLVSAVVALIGASAWRLNRRDLNR
ncbi:ABC transporter permease subunit [Micromonospora sp. CA-244673]|uniref:ABC transporter permease subunit n=1 Tax=Micromonospora sp. CA-244673 TaxID=3239958 RepID=UPI003D94AF64